MGANDRSFLLGIRNYWWCIKLLESWNNHKKEGTFLNGEHTPLESFRPIYYRGTTGESYAYDVICENVVEQYVAIKHIGHSTIAWNIIETPIKNLNTVCY